MRRVCGAVLLWLAVSLAGCAVTSGSQRESVGEWVHSTRITSVIEARFQADRVLAPLGLRVETYRREVFVSGLVQNDSQRARAVAIARDTSGVLDAYFVDTDLRSRPVSRAHYRASLEAVWTATLAAVRTAGYQIEDQRDGHSLVTQWKRVEPRWLALWLATQERLRLALYPHGAVVTVIAVADRLDQGNLTWQIDREEAILDKIREALDTTASRRP